MLTFEKTEHKYSWEGVSIPSVSSILAGAGFTNFDMVNKADMDRAQERGTIAHENTEFYDIGILDEDSVDPALVGYLEAWKKFVADYNPKFLMIEKRLCNLKLWYAGTVDRVASIKRTRTLIDIKTGIKSKAHEIQHGGYSMLDGIGNIKQCWTVYLKPDGKYSIEIHNQIKGQEIFKAALTIQQYKNRSK